MAAGSGPYDGVLDHWSARVGALPHVIADLVGPTSFPLFRAVSLATAFAGVAVFVIGVARRHGAVLALLAGAALATTWGFFQISHWIRWDAMALLFSCVFLAALARGPPRPRVAALLGAMLALAPDFSVSVLAAFPGVLLLVAWAADDRAARVKAFIGGVLCGALALFVLHAFWDLDAARRQYDEVFRATYGEMPLLAALQDLSVNPIRADVERYRYMTGGPGRDTLLTLVAAGIAVVLLPLSDAGMRRNVLLTIATTGVMALGVVLVIAPADAYAVLYRAFPVVLIAGAALLAWSLLRRFGTYPTQAVPGVLFLSQLGGLALLVGNKGGSYPALALPYGIAAITELLSSLSGSRMRWALPAVGLSAMTVAGALVIAGEARHARMEPALMSEVERVAGALVRPSQTIVGDHVYWWLFRDHRFLYNSAIWQARWSHGDSLPQAVHRLCPDYVLLDDIWLYRYEHLETGWNYPNLAPTDPTEATALRRLLRAEYRPVRRLTPEGRTLVFLRRRASGDCFGRAGL